MGLQKEGSGMKIETGRENLQNMKKGKKEGIVNVGIIQLRKESITVIQHLII